MIARIKKFLLFSLLLLPLGAFADITTPLSYLTPPQGDFSLQLLNRVFGSVGTSLSGYGNQMVGTVIGVFNAFWVIIIGIAVMYVVWDSVITAAQNGEMMSGRGGKKTVFTILRIVVGFSLVVPSASSGYSLAQNGVMWVVVQGVGLADQVSAKLNTFTRSGGLVVNNKPTQGKDLTQMTPLVANILKAQICMYKLEEIIDKEKKQQQAVQQDNKLELPQTSGDTYVGDKVGYSINSNTNTITMGGLNPHYNADDPKSPRYNADCGSLSWDGGAVANYARITNNGKNVNDKTMADLDTADSYLEQGATEMFNNLLPVAKAIASVDTKAEDSNSTFTEIANRGGVLMANSTMSYATLLDPLRFASASARNDRLSQKMDEMAAKGWIYTPLSIILPGLSQMPLYKIADVYPPMTTVAQVNKDGLLDGGVFNEMNPNDIKEIIALMNRVDGDEYAAKSNTVLQSDNMNSEGPGLNFENILDEYTRGGRDLDTIMSYINFGFDAATWVLDFSKAASGAMLDGASFVLDLTQSIGDTLTDSYNKVTGGLDSATNGDCLSDIFLHGNADSCSYQEGDASMGDGSKIAEAKERLEQAKNGINSALGSVESEMAGFKKSIEAELEYSQKGGMNAALAELTKKAGPTAPLFTAVMTNMIGHGIDSLQYNMFENKDYNAFNAAIVLGGTMMSSAMTSFFQFAQITFYLEMVKKIGGLMEKAPSFVGTLGSIASGLSGLVVSVWTPFVGFYVGFATIFFLGGAMLYLLMPLTFIFGFTASAFRWIGMAFINILAAPIFCFNLIRADGEGFVGRGEKYLADLARTAVTPAVLTLGAVAFMILFNVAFLLLSTIYAEFLPVVFEIYRSDVLMAITLGITLLVFCMIILWLSQMLTTLCTAEFVQAIEHAIGEGIQRMGDNSPTEKIREAVTGGGQHITGLVKGLNKSDAGGDK